MTDNSGVGGAQATAASGRGPSHIPVTTQLVGIKPIRAQLNAIAAAFKLDKSPADGVNFALEPELQLVETMENLAEQMLAKAARLGFLENEHRMRYNPFFGEQPEGGEQHGGAGPPGGGQDAVGPRQPAARSPHEQRTALATEIREYDGQSPFAPWRAQASYSAQRCAGLAPDQIAAVIKTKVVKQAASLASGLPEWSNPGVPYGALLDALEHLFAPDPAGLAAALKALTHGSKPNAAMVVDIGRAYEKCRTPAPLGQEAIGNLLLATAAFEPAAGAAIRQQMQLQAIGQPDTAIWNMAVLHTVAEQYDRAHGGAWQQQRSKQNKPPQQQSGEQQQPPPAGGPPPYGGGRGGGGRGNGGRGGYNPGNWGGGGRGGAGRGEQAWHPGDMPPSRPYPGQPPQPPQQPQMGGHCAQMRVATNTSSEVAAPALVAAPAAITPLQAAHMAADQQAQRTSTAADDSARLAAANHSYLQHLRDRKPDTPRPGLPAVREEQLQPEAGQPALVAASARTRARSTEQQTAAPGATARRPRNAEPFLPGVDDQPAQGDQQPQEQQQRPTHPAYELPQLPRVQIVAGPGPQRHSIMQQLSSSLKGSFTLDMLASVCADPAAVQALAQLHDVAHAGGPRTTMAATQMQQPGSYVAAAAALPNPAPATAITSSLTVAATEPAASSRVTITKNVGDMPAIAASTMSERDARGWFNDDVLLHLDPGAGMSCIRADAAQRLSHQLSRLGARRIRLAVPVEITPVGDGKAYAHEMLTAVHLKVGRACLKLDLLIVPAMPTEFLLGMDYIPSYDITSHWRSNTVSMAINDGMLAPGAAMPVCKRTGRVQHRQVVSMYTRYRTMHLAYTQA